MDDGRYDGKSVPGGARDMEPDVEKAIPPSPSPPIDLPNVKRDSGTTSSLSSQTAGRNGHDEISVHSATVNEKTDKNDEKENGLAPSVSAASEHPPPVKVPRSKRRGLFARFALVAEIEEPKHYSRGIKWYITFVIALAAVAAPLGSTIILRTALGRRLNLRRILIHVV